MSEYNKILNRDSSVSNLDSEDCHDAHDSQQSSNQENHGQNQENQGQQSSNQANQDKIKVQTFKQTKLGLIPGDWEVKTILELADSKKQLFDDGDWIESEHITSDGIRLIQTGNIGIGKFIEKEDKKYINELSFAKLNCKQLFEGDLLICRLAEPAGRACLLPKLPYDKIITSVDVTIFRPRAEVADRIFLMNVFSTSNWFKQIYESVGGTTHKRISRGSLGKVLVQVPNIEEQKAIAQVLSDTETLIQTLEQKLVKKRAIKQGAMQQLLTPKEGWERVKLSKVIEVNRGGSPRPIQDYITSSPSGINWIKIGDTSRTSKYIVSSEEKIIPEGIHNSRQVKVGDFLLSNSMSFGRPYILKIDGCIHDGWLVLQNYQDSFDREFLYYTLMSEDVFKQYLTKASGSGVLNLNKELVKTVELNKPKTLEEQTRIATILSDMDAEIAQLEQKLDKYKLLKQGLMQELLTGRIRLI